MNSDINDNRISNFFIYLLLLLIIVIAGVAVYLYSNHYFSPQVYNNGYPNAANNTNITPTIAPQIIFPVASAQIEITDKGFSPASLLIGKGSHVTWVNKSSKPHKLTLSDSSNPLPGFSFDTALDQGDTYSFTFNQTGTFTYYDPMNTSFPQGEIMVK